MYVIYAVSFIADMDYNLLPWLHCWNFSNCIFANIFNDLDVAKKRYLNANSEVNIQHTYVARIAG